MSLLVGAIATAGPAEAVELDQLHPSTVLVQDQGGLALGEPLRVRSAGRTSEALQRPAKLEVRGVLLEEALTALYEASEVPLIFSPDFVPEIEVACECSDVTVETALRHLLRGTNLQFLASTGQVVIAPGDEPAAVKAGLAGSSVLPRVTSSGIGLLRRVEQGQVIGTVTQEDTGEPLAAVQVFIEGTDIASLTSNAGAFTLNDVPVGTHTVVAQRIGYLTERNDVTVAEGQATTLNVTLAQSALALEELVVIGYGTQERREVTGSVASVSGADIRDIPVPSFENALQGRLAGVNVAEASGEPGSAPQLIIRGAGSISAGNEPLYVIDGVPYSLNLDQQGEIDQQNANFGETRANPLANLNPNDIENIEILKDAAAASIYGSRGSNGVVLITTKRGIQNTPPSVNFRAYGGYQTAFNKPDMMNAQEQIEFVKLSRNNAYLMGRDPLNPASPYYNPAYDPDTNSGREATGASGTEMIPEAMVNWDGTDTNWVDAVLDPAALQNYDVAVRGGGSNFTYYVSGSYMNQSGIIEGSAFERLALRTNLTMDPSEALQVNLDVNAAYGDHDRKQAHAPYFGRPPGIIYSAMVASPVVRIVDDEGNYLQQGENSINSLGNGMTSSNHPLAARDYIDDKFQTGRVFGSLSGSYELPANLRFKSLFGYDYDTSRRHFYQGTQLEYRGSTEPDPYAEQESGTAYNWLLENTLTHSAALGQHSFDTLVGYTAQKQFNETADIIARNFPDDKVTTINGGEITGGGQEQSEWSLVSMLGRLNYTFLDRYMATFTIRSDRSSRFGWGNQTGVFPSASIGWQVTEEPFMRGVELFSQLKPRVSYGVTGNFAIPNYGSIGLVGSAPYVFGDAIAPGATPETLGNQELTWETTRQLNMGLDVGFLGDRVYGAFDYYISNTEDLLLDVNVPSSTGFATVLTNIGEVKNTGFEAQVTTRNLVGDLRWTSDFSFGSNWNEVIRLGPEGDPILSAGAAGVRHITQVGGEVGAYYGYVHDGVFMSQAEIDAAPVDLEGNVTVGDIRFKDINGDGFIDADDRTEIGSYNPNFTWGIMNQFGFGNFEMSFFFQGVQGREILNLTRRHMTGEGNFNLYGNLVGNYYKSPEEPGNGWDPKPDRNSHGGSSRESNYLIEDGSYISFKSISMGYTVPPNLLGRIASNARLFASVNNVFMWTDYWGWNPEASIRSDGLTPGQDYGAYPLMRAFQVGIDIGL
ncbi:MAG: TonB-dependent receptor [Gemmatimonadota bacterium]